MQRNSALVVESPYQIHFLEHAWNVARQTFNTDNK